MSTIDELLSDKEAVERTLKRLQEELALAEHHMDEVKFSRIQYLRKSISDFTDHLEELCTGTSRFDRVFKNVMDRKALKPVDELEQVSIQSSKIDSYSYFRRLYERTARNWLVYLKNRWR